MFLSICQSFLIALSKWMKNWDDKINNHGHNKLLKDGRKNISAWSIPTTSFLVQFILLSGQQRSNRSLQLYSHPRYSMNKADSMFNQTFIESKDNKKLLDMHFNDGLADECGSKKCPKWDKEMTTCNSCQVKQGVRYGSTEKDAYEPNLLYGPLHSVLPSLYSCHCLRILQLFLKKKYSQNP